MNSSAYGRRLADLMARSEQTDREAAEALLELRTATAEAVAAADALIHAIETAPSPEVTG